MFGIPLSLPQYILLAVLALICVAYLAKWVLDARGDDDTRDTEDERELVDLVFKRVGEDGEPEETERVEEVVVDNGAVEHPRPNLQTATFGLLEEFVRFYRRRQKHRKLARKGYVKWILAGQTYSRPKFVRPQTKGGGIPEFEYDGTTYLFPRGAAAADEAAGMWTFVHKKGESDPVNLRDPLRTSIPGDTLKEYLTMRVSSDPPGWLDSLDVSPRKIVIVLMAAIVVFSLLRRGM